MKATGLLCSGTVQSRKVCQGWCNIKLLHEQYLLTKIAATSAAKKVTVFLLTISLSSGYQRFVHYKANPRYCGISLGITTPS